MENKSNADTPQAEAAEAFSATVIDHANNPRNMHDMQNPDGLAIQTGICGDTLGIWLRVRDDIIKDISFVTDGCGTSIASGSMVTELAKGKSVAEGMEISEDDVLDALGGLPEDSEHCAVMASSTLKAAIRDYLAMKQEPWKKNYRK